MKSAFSVYPAGRAGLALALLRGAAITTIAGLAQSQPDTWFSAATIIVALLLGIGFLTRTAAAACIAIDLIALVQGMACSPLSLASQLLGVAAVALVGPGAWSADAWLFGRRTIALVPRNRGE